MDRSRLIGWEQLHFNLQSRCQPPAGCGQPRAGPYSRAAVLPARCLTKGPTPPNTVQSTARWWTSEEELILQRKMNLLPCPQYV
ncbi:hypothetical protein BDA96_02G447600 [Sorghum bicolor]|uniref:Uncharacterized protein n=2 Tax=Sorghum bicolor TaxID=4558 RepID=A0A921RV03_SORBI|nr:hypothetical protein BDA96_02G447600 [Sorghum bicolor]OQU90544.1 hypothetical protein SORBI_3002G427201 [Sorghum bicolor]